MEEYYRPKNKMELIEFISGMYPDVVVWGKRRKVNQLWAIYYAMIKRLRATS